MPERLIIVWDVDDVLNCLMESWLDYWNKKNNSNVCYNEIKNNPPNKILGISKKLYLSNLDEFRNSEAGKNVKVNSIIKSWFKKNGNRFINIACTARPIHTMYNQSYWIYKNFGKWIHSICVADPARDTKANINYISKAEYISLISRPVLFIDDSEENINSVSESGADTLVYPQPWNKNDLTIEEFLNKLNSKLKI